MSTTSSPIPVPTVAAPAPTKRRDVHLGDQLFHLLLRGAGLVVLVLIGAIVVQLLELSFPAVKQFGIGFLAGTNWDPVNDSFGAFPVIYGTVVSSILAIVIACPIAVGASIFLNEIAHAKIARPLGFLIEMLAAIPSVVYGLWGIFVLAPWLRVSVQPWIGEKFGFLPLFQGPPFGVGMLCAGIVLAIMITPTIAAISREVFKAIPLSHREAVLALGATRWEMIWVSVLRASVPGVLGAVILGLGRALGETMAVTMVIGNRADISASLFAPGQTMASLIANEYPEASGASHIAALASIGLTLFLVSLIINSFARLVVWRFRRQQGGAR
jgi:phosphate transport system permease protein